MSSIRRYLNYANIVATLALVFAMSGGALPHHLDQPDQPKGAQEAQGHTQGGLHPSRQRRPKGSRRRRRRRRRKGGKGRRRRSGSAGADDVAGGTVRERVLRVG